MTADQRRLAAIVSADVIGYSRLTCLLLLRVVGHLPLMDEATDTGGRCPTSLRGGNRGPSSLGGAARTMGMVALRVVAGSVRLVEFEQRGAIADGQGVARRRWLRSGACWTETPERASMQL